MMINAAPPELDLTISRVIRAPRSAVWKAWTDPRSFEQWWIPAPARCRVVEMNLRPGGAFSTEMSEGDGDFTPHLNACFLHVVDGEQLVFTTVLEKGWRPVEDTFIHMTAVITLEDHPDGTAYTARVMHRNDAERDRHVEMGFYDGWGTVIGQLAALVEGR